MKPPAAPAGPRGALPPGAVELTSRLLHFCASPSASVRDAERLIAGLSDANDPAVAVAAVNMIRDIHGLLADAAFPSFAAREQQRRALLDLSTKLVAAEEAAFAE